MMTLKICLLVLTSFYIAEANVLGIDFGSEFFKVALISPGKSFIIIENTNTKRKTDNVVAFANQERFYEADGAGKRLKNTKNTFVFLKKFLGALSNDEQVIAISRQNIEDYLLETDPLRKTFSFKLDNFKIEKEKEKEDESDDLVLRVEELVAMILKFSLQLVNRQFGITPKQCVITVPSSWGVNQRAALKLAARIAGLEIFAFIHDNSAAALYYGLERQDNSTHTVLFYNIGSYYVQATLAEYIAVESTSQKKLIETITILSDYSVANAGGVAYDQALAAILATKFNQLPSRKGKKPLEENRRGYLKLIKHANKFKEVLSANKDAPIHIEGLADNEDFHAHIDRANFEEAILPLLQKTIQPIQKALQYANKELKDIDVVELIGGGIRVPKVQQKLQEFFGDQVEIGLHLNGDECMALGAAFHAANMSHSFKVRPIQFSDGFSFEMMMNISDENGYFKSFQLFPYKKRFGAKKSVEFEHDSNVKIEVFIVTPEEETSLFVTYYLNNITDIQQDEKLKSLGVPKISMEFETNSHEILIFNSASLQLEEIKLIEIKEKNRTKVEPKKKTETVTPPPPKPISEEEEDKEQKQQHAQQDQQEAEEDNQEQKEQQTEQESQEKSEQQQEAEEEQNSEEQTQKTEQASEQSEESQLKQEAQNNEEDGENGEKKELEEEKEKEEEEVKKEPTKQYKKQTILHNMGINVTAVFNVIQQLNSTEIHKSQKVLRQFDSYEEKQRKLSEVKNKLESLVYMIREIVEQKEFMKFSVEEERNELLTKANEHHEYLESDAAFEGIFEDFNKKLIQLRNLMKPIEKRMDEAKARPEAINDTLTKLADFEKKAVNLNLTMPWVKENEKKDLVEILKNQNISSNYQGIRPNGFRSSSRSSR